MAATYTEYGMSWRDQLRRANTTQRAVSYYETEAGFPPTEAAIDLARALKAGTDELLRVRSPQS